MTCEKHCLHWEVCKLTPPEYATAKYYTFCNCAEKCECFKDKSKYIELPCKVGDIVYYIAGKRIYKSNVHCISFGGRNNFDCGQIHIYDYDGDNASRKLSDFGKIFFLTREEAEAKLKELNENAE